jgi:hypothetical protein
MFRILILQASHALSDERTEYLVKDRLSFMRFLGLGLADRVPDANSIWNFREALTRAQIDGSLAICSCASRRSSVPRAPEPAPSARGALIPKRRNRILGGVQVADAGLLRMTLDASWTALKLAPFDRTGRHGEGVVSTGLSLAGC